MRRGSSKELRDRILTDEEIRTLWKATGTVGDLTKLLLLTAQRREKVAAMKWDDISNGAWSVPRKPRRQKGTGGDLVLPGIALDIINAVLAASQQRGGGRVPFTEAELTKMRGGLTAEEYRWKTIRKWGKR